MDSSVYEGATPSFFLEKFNQIESERRKESEAKLGPGKTPCGEMGNFNRLFDESSAQLMGAAARLHANQPRLEMGGESAPLRTAQAPAQDDLAGPIESDKVKHALRYIDAYRRYCHEWSSFGERTRKIPRAVATPLPPLNFR